MTAFFTMPDGSRRAYQRQLPAVDDSRPGILFLTGHGSDMLGTKAELLADYASQHGLGYLRFDYSGHGQSDGELNEGTISQWVDDSIKMLDALTTGPQILVGSSLGGWVMLRVSQERKDRVAGLVGIAAAPDFTEHLIWQTLDDAQQAKMISDGFIAVDNPYSEDDVIYTHKLVVDGRDNLVLGSKIALDVPVFLHQGMCDEEVPFNTAFDIASCLDSTQIQIILDKGAGHRYSESAQLDALIASLDQIYGYYHRQAQTG